MKSKLIATTIAGGLLTLGGLVVNQAHAGTCPDGDPMTQSQGGYTACAGGNGDPSTGQGHVSISSDSGGYLSIASDGSAPEWLCYSETGNPYDPENQGDPTCQPMPGAP